MGNIHLIAEIGHHIHDTFVMIFGDTISIWNAVY
jgi:hypothetical protein